MARAPKVTVKAVDKKHKINAKGKLVAKDPKKMAIAKKAAHALKGKPKSAAHRLAISKALKLSRKKGISVKTGRPLLKPGPKAKAGSAKKPVAKKVAAKAPAKKTAAKKAPVHKIAGKKVAAKPVAKKTVAKKPAAKAAPAKRGRPAKVAAPVAKKRGRPAGSTNKPKVAAKKPVAKKTTKRRGM